MLIRLTGEQGAEDEPDVHGDGRQPAVMAGHDAEALEEGLTVVKGGLAFLGIIGDNHVEVVKRDVFLGGGLHDANTPVDIGRVTVTEVVRCGDGKVGTGVEGLMTDEHTVAEGFPGEMFWRSEAAMMKETTFGVDNIGVAIQHGRLIGNGGNDARDSIGGREEVTGIEETDVVTVERAEPFVHGVVDAMIMLRGNLNTMTVVGSIGTPDIVLDDLKGAVCGSPINNEMYDVTIVLP